MSQTPFRGVAHAKQFLDKGLAQQDSAHYEVSNTSLKRAAALYLDLNKPIMAAHCFNHISSNARLISKLDIAEKWAQKALNILQQYEWQAPTEQVRAYTNLGLISAIRSRYEQSLARLQKAYELTRQADIGPGLTMVVIGSLGYLYDDLGKYDEALFYYNKSLDMLMEQPSPSQDRLAKLYNNIGVAYANKGFHAKALQYYRLELQTNLQIKGASHPDVAGTYLNIGSSYFRNGDVGEALIYYKKAYRNITQAYGTYHNMTALALENIARCYLKLGRYKKGIQPLEKAISIKKEVLGASHPSLAAVYNQLGTINEQMDRWEDAYHNYQQALALQQQSLPANHPDIAGTHNHLATFYLEEGQPAAALKSLQTAENILLASVGAEHPHMAATYTSMARAYGMQDDISQSILFYQKALHATASFFEGEEAGQNPTAALIEYPVQARLVLGSKAKSLAQFYAETKKVKLLKASLATYKALTKLLDHLQRSYFDKTSKLALGKKSHTMFEQAIRTAYQLHTLTNERSYLEAVFYFAEKSKGRVVLEAVTNAQAKHFAGIPDSLLQNEQQLENALINVQQQIYTVSESNGEINSFSFPNLRDSLFILNRKLTEHSRYLKENYSRYHRLMYNSHIPSVSSIQDRLNPGKTVMIEYFYGTQHLWAIIIAADQFQVISLPYQTDLAIQVAQLKETLADRRDKEYTQLAFGLYKALIQPIQPYIASYSSLLIVPDGPLGLLPFGALVEKEITAVDGSAINSLPYLIKSYDIGYATSIVLNSTLQMGEDPDYDKAFIGFAPVFSNDQVVRTRDIEGRTQKWSPLFFSSYEVHKVANLFKDEDSFWNFFGLGKSKTSLFLHEEATKDAFMHLEDSSARYIHLATHAFVKDGINQQSGIVFYPNKADSDKDILYTKEVYNLRLNAALISLSACATGAGKVVKGEGIMGISRAFQYAGINNMLVSLWKVDDRSTALLMTAFYRHLLQDQSMSQALSQAKRKMISRRRYAHPRYWAPFILLGNTGI